MFVATRRNTFYASRIQRWFRALYIRDPITYGRLRAPYFKLGNILYNANVLATFITETGDCRDPISRDPITEEDLVRLDTITSSGILRSLPDLMVKRKNDKDLSDLLGFYMTEIMEVVDLYIRNAYRNCNANCRIISGSIVTYILNIPLSIQSLFIEDVLINIHDLLKEHPRIAIYINDLRSKVEITKYVELVQCVPNPQNPVQV